MNAIVGVREYCETDVTVKGSALDVAPNSFVTDTLYVTSEDKITIDTLSDSEIHEDKQRVVEGLILDTAPEEIQNIVKAMR